ncbi:translation initiation factor IF-2 [Rhodotorula toruloides]|uniref:Translation initiation factor IF-2 n=1 Tax=Rhodotorula toruloides TaxID=5286 RepID=A0A511K8W8_RHOTO|nr:translation initiation factor IF-2 [Rhodotorula toruloides]
MFAVHTPPASRLLSSRVSLATWLRRVPPSAQLDVVLLLRASPAMEESLEGLQLPLFSGSWADDWATHEARLRSWLSVRGMPLHSREAAETLAVSLYAQAAADFEREAGPVERRVFEEGAAWCRGRWADEQRTKLAMTSALNKLTARSFRERGRRREMVQDLVDDLEKLFLQAKIVEDDDRRRAFLGCFLEFPGLVKRLTAKDSFVSAIEEALVWEGEMVLKERRKDSL